jgi:hypothetical protein
VLAPERPEDLELRRVLHALGHGGQRQAVTELHDRPGNRPVRRRREVGDEGAVDLQDVDRQAVEVGQRGVARPEVIDRDMDAELAQGARGRPRR